ncbi:MAG TPA: hypothetical protein VK604_09140 [Bryobacteraceae bacterium]|nr:hypothetical protein [Bryobacteraceae bacterium]
MLLRFALVLSALSGVVLAAEPAATQLFPNQDKSLTQLNRQAFDKQVGAFLSGKQDKPLARQFQLAQAFPAITKDRVVCAIPLREVKVKNSAAMDRMGIPAGKTDFDKMAKAAPVPACKNWQ